MKGTRGGGAVKEKERDDGARESENETERERMLWGNTNLEVR